TCVWSVFFFSSRRRHTRSKRDWSSDVCSSDLVSLEDGSHTVFLSTCGENKDEVPEELVKFLMYVKAELKESTGDFRDSFVKRIRSEERRVGKGAEAGGCRVMQEGGGGHDVRAV